MGNSYNNLFKATCKNSFGACFTEMQNDQSRNLNSLVPYTTNLPESIYINHSVPGNCRDQRGT